MKKWARFLAAFLSLLMLLSLAACGASAEDVVKNLLGVKNADVIRQKDYKTPEEFYRAVELRRAKEHIGMLTGAANLETISAEKIYLQNDLTVVLNQDALDRDVLNTLTQLAGMDLSWMKSAGVSIAAGRQDNLGVLNAVIRLNDKDIISANAVLDNAASTAYVAVPELSDQYFTIDLSDAANSLLGAHVDSSSVSGVLSGSWIDPVQVTALIERYYGVALDNITKIQVNAGNVAVGGVSCKCSVAEVTLEGEDFMRIAKACLTEAQNDTQLEEILYNALTMAGSYSGSPLSFHSEYLDTLSKALSSLDKVSFIDIPITARMTVYIDAKGEILGRKVVVQRDSEQIVFSFLTARDGTKLGVEGELGFYASGSGTVGSNDAYQSSLFITGSGSYASSGKLQGEFQLRVYRHNAYDDINDDFDMPIGVVSADGTLGRDGFIGELILTPSEILKNMYINNVYNPPESVQRLINSLSLAIVNKSGGDKTNLTLSLRSDGKDLLSVSFVQAPAKALNFSIPANASDFRTWTGSLGFASLSALLNNLSAAGVPNSVLNSIGR